MHSKSFPGDPPSIARPRFTIEPGDWFRRRRTRVVPASLAAGIVLVTLGILIGLQVRETATPQLAHKAPPPGRNRPGADTIRAPHGSGHQSHREQLLDSPPSKLASCCPHRGSA
jgi:hypothetical protein